MVWRRRKAANAAATTSSGETHAPVEAKLPEALAALSGFRLRCGWWLRLRIDEGNTMVALHERYSQRLERYGRFTERMKIKLKRVAVSGEVSAYGCSDVLW